METLVAKIADLLLDNGILGVIIIVLGFYVYRQEGAIKGLRDKIDALQDKRFEEAATTIRALADSTRAIEDVTEATEANNRTLEFLVKAMDLSMGRPLDHRRLKP